MSVLMEFSMFPTDKGESVSPYVSRVIEMIRESGISYQLTPMGTVIETDEVSEALAIVERAGHILGEVDCRRIYASIKLDIRSGKHGRLAQKIRSVEERIGKVNT